MYRQILLALLTSSILISSAYGADEPQDNTTSNANPAEEATQTGEPTTVTKVKSTSAKAAPIRSYWTLDFTTLQWNETLSLVQGSTTATDTANFSGLSLGLQREWTQGRWGWSVGGFVGTGRANGGGNTTTLAYQSGRQSFSMFAFTPRGFYRLSGRVSMGITAMGYYRKIDWPTVGGVSVADQNRNFSLTALADLNLRLSSALDIYQGIGPLEKNGTFWKIGLAYRF